MSLAILVENLSKQYRLGLISSRTFGEDLNRWWSRVRKKSHPVQKIGEKNVEGDLIWALRNVSFQVKKGEAVGIIGRNGAGKSTLLKILSRVTAPTSGVVKMKGRLASLLEVGTGFHPELTGRENIFLNGTILGMTKAEISGRFDEIVAFSEIEKFIDTPVKHYSSGMYVRLAFAVAAHIDAEILLIDETLAVGDAGFQKKCLGKMGLYAKEGRTVLFVSHNLAAIRNLCDRCIMIELGQITAEGDLEDCIDRYLQITGDTGIGVDTAALPRPSFILDSTFRITRVKLETSSGQAILKTGEPIVLYFDFRSENSIQDIVFGWSVHSQEGIRLFECRSLDSHGLISRLEAGTYSLRSVLPVNPLNPGVYTIHVGARCADKGLDYVSDVAIFRVESAEKFASFWLESPNSLLKVQSEWDYPVLRDTNVI